jgi:hypothetical protein
MLAGFVANVLFAVDCVPSPGPAPTLDGPVTLAPIPGAETVAPEVCGVALLLHATTTATPKSANFFIAPARRPAPFVVLPWWYRARKRVGHTDVCAQILGTQLAHCDPF